MEMNLAPSLVPRLSRNANICYLLRSRNGTKQKGYVLRVWPDCRLSQAASRIIKSQYYDMVSRNMMS